MIIKKKKKLSSFNGKACHFVHANVLFQFDILCVFHFISSYVLALCSGFLCEAFRYNTELCYDYIVASIVLKTSKNVPICFIISAEKRLTVSCKCLRL